MMHTVLVILAAQSDAVIDSHALLAAVRAGTRITAAAAAAVAHGAVACNWHLGFLGARACMLAVLAFGALQTRQHERAREHAVESAAHILLAWLAR